MSGPVLWGKGEAHNIASVREIGNLYSKMFFRLLRECVVGH